MEEGLEVAGAGALLRGRDLLGGLGGVLGALDGPLGAQSAAGLKRRTRATMGRCQGFYCTAAIARLTEGRLAQPMVGADG